MKSNRIKRSLLLLLSLLVIFSCSGSFSIGEDILLEIDGNTVDVEWEENASIDTLKSLLRNNPITITATEYGGFEQVGKLPSSLPSSDASITASTGDIVLYNSSSIVIFYGSNTWEYTRLGHISNSDIASLLAGKGSVTLRLSLK